MLEIGMVEDGDLDGYLVRRSEWTGTGVKWRFKHPMVLDRRWRGKLPKFEFVKCEFQNNRD